MIELLDQPAVVIVAAALASVCLLLEVALPTVGLAGSTGAALALLAAWGVGRQDADWWPLLGIVAAVALWGGLIAARRASSFGHPIAVGLFLAGALGYGVAADDVTAMVTAASSTAVLVVIYPRIGAAAERLGGARPAVGPGSMVGAKAVVVDWDGAHGHVLIGGTRWSASTSLSGPASEQLVVDDTVIVASVTGLSLGVRPVVSRHG
jgi:membrane-bound ClpP family serine protease